MRLVVRYGLSNAKLGGTESGISCGGLKDGKNGELAVSFASAIGQSSSVGGAHTDSAVPVTSNIEINKMLAEFRAEREQVEEAIMMLERLAHGRVKRRGQPPAWMSQMKKCGRPPGSDNETASLSSLQMSLYQKMSKSAREAIQ